jgi:hypothetical protein
MKNHIAFAQFCSAGVGNLLTKRIQIFNNCFLAGLAILAVVVLFSFPASAQWARLNPARDFALAGRPANVPTNYVITPFGYFHPSCARLLAEGDRLLPDGRVEHVNGMVDAIASVCDYPHYTRTGVLIPSNPEGLRGINLPTINGWLEYVSVTTPSLLCLECLSVYGKISARWVVPPAPNTYDGQTLFFFPGFEDINDVISIVQPVMQYGVSAGGGGSFWAVQSWNCCISGVTWFSPLLEISTGDIIQGTITSTCAPGSYYCARWNVISKDVTTGQTTTLAKTPADGQVWNWAFGAVTEDYGVDECSEFPANSRLTLTVQLYDQNLVRIADPAWVGTGAAPGTTPNCSYGVETSNTKETVEY